MRRLKIGMTRQGGAWLTGVLVSLVLCLGASAQATYEPGQDIQYSDTGETWTDAKYLGLTPDGTQAMVAEPNAYSQNGVFKRAVSLKRMRAKPEQGVAPPAQAAVAPGASAQATYEPGQDIQYSDTGETWTDAKYLGLTPDGTQAMVAEPNAYSQNGVFKRAVSLKRMRAKPP